MTAMVGDVQGYQCFTHVSAKLIVSCCPFTIIDIGMELFCWNFEYSRHQLLQNTIIQNEFFKKPIMLSLISSTIEDTGNDCFCIILIPGAFP